MKYCRNCGKQIEDAAVVCSNCCVPVYIGMNYCQHCGLQTEKNLERCQRCDTLLEESYIGNLKLIQKSKTTAMLLATLLGFVGAHNFYLGNKKKAWIQLLLTVLSIGTLLVASMLWGLVDFVAIYQGKVKTDAYGIPLADNFLKKRRKK